MKEKELGPIACHPTFGLVSRAMSRRDVSWVTGWLCGRYGIAAGTEWVERCIKRAAVKENSDWSDDSWAMWWKNRIAEAGLFGVPGCSPNSFDAYGCPMHVGFLHLEETDEMIEFLRNELAPDPDAKRRMVVSPGIERIQTSPLPIDRVAARVASFPRSTES